MTLRDCGIQIVHDRVNAGGPDQSSVQTAVQRYVRRTRKPAECASTSCFGDDGYV